jgi:hypothetical protein
MRRRYHPVGVVEEVSGWAERCWQVAGAMSCLHEDTERSVHSRSRKEDTRGATFSHAEHGSLSLTCSVVEAASLAQNHGYNVRTVICSATIPSLCLAVQGRRILVGGATADIT